MDCECQVCKDLKHLQDCGVSEDFINRWINEGQDAAVNKAILDGTWPSSVEWLQNSLEKVKQNEV